jgi:hypothetical protein
MSEPRDLINDWQPATLQQYCLDLNLGYLKDTEAYLLHQSLSRCPIVGFEMFCEAGETRFVCVLTDECEPLFAEEMLRPSDFAPTLIRFEKDRPPHATVHTPISPDDDDLYCELFNEAFVRFIDLVVTQ